MSASAFAIQLVFCALIVGFLYGRTDKLARVYVTVWLGINLVVVFRYGVDGQLVFYSNDQRYYVDVVQSIVHTGLPIDVDWWLTASRWPYTLPASLLSLAGLESALAAKVVSLLFLLASMRLVQSRITPLNTSKLFIGTYLTALGGIGIFFSALALRETAMMYFALVIFLGKTSSSKGIAIILLFFLRQHLAIAVVIGLVIITLLRRTHRSVWTPLRAVLTVVAGNAIGYLAFSLGFEYLRGASGVFGHQLGLRPVARIFSNYFGLQFLTAYEESLEFSVSALIASRLLFSETVVIPLLFTALALTSRRFSSLDQSVLLAFSIYVGLVTNTEFNSFRQNIPLIPIMGFVIVQHLLNRQSSPTLPIGSHET